MIRYTCIPCKVEMVCEKNDVPLIHFTNNDREQGIDVVRFGDIWACPNCDCKVMLGMGGQILGYLMKSHKEFLKDHPNFVEVKR